MLDNWKNTQKWVAWNPSLRSRTQQFNDFVNNAKQQKTIEKNNATDKQNQELFTAWMNTKFHDVANQCNRAVRMSQTASWAKDYLSSLADFSDIDFWDDKWTDWAVINAYKAAFPETASIMKKYVTDDNNVNCDPTEFYKEMWWDMSEWEERIDQALSQAFAESNITPREFAENVWNTLLEPIRITSKWVRTLGNIFENMQYSLWEALWVDMWISKEDNSEMNAIIQYALDTYTDNWMRWQLTEDELNQATKDLMNNPELASEYMWKQNVLNWIVETWLWGAWLTAELWWLWWIPAAVNWALSVWLNLPATAVPMQALLTPLTLLSEWFNYVLEETPAVNKVWNLLDDDTKTLVSYYLSWKTIGSAFRRNPKTGKIEIRPVIKNITKNIYGNLMEGIDWVKSKKKETVWNTSMLGRQWWTEITTPEQAKSVKNLDLETNKVVNSKTIAENKDITKAFAQLDRDELKKLAKNKNVDYEDIFRANEKEVKSGIKNEDTIAETIDKKRWPENDLWESDDITVRWWFKWWPKVNHPIQEFFEKMEIMTKDSSPNLRSALDWRKNKYLAWELDAQDLLNFKRWLSKEYIKYKYKNEWKDLLVSDQEFNRIYEWLNYLIRDAVESIPEFREMGLWNIMTTLDQRVSPHLNLRWRLVTLMNKVNEEIWHIPSDINKRKLGNKVREATSLWWIFRILADFFTKSKERMSNAVDFQQNLHVSLKKINEMLKEFPDNERWQIINSMTEYLKKKYAWVKEVYWWKVEWEVVEEPIFDFIDWDAEYNKNPYLEDKVEIVPKESNMIWENPWVWPDLQEPIRVTPEWFAWVGNANIEWYKNPFEWSIQQIYRDAYKKAMENAWFSETQIDTVLDKLETNNYKISQQSLFWEWEIKAWPKSDAKLDLKPIEEELNELEKTENAAKASNPKKVTKEDIDHLFWNKMSASEKARETVRKAMERNWEWEVKSTEVNKPLLDKYSKMIDSVKTIDDAVTLRGKIWSDKQLSDSPKTRSKLDSALDKVLKKLKKW